VSGIHLTTKERERFRTSYFVHPLSGCWIWFRASDRDGYGMFFWRGQYVYTHRFSFQLHVGPIESGGHVCHTCDRPQCINPDHLFVGTAKENARDCVSKGRQWASGGRHYAHTKLTRADVAAIRGADGSHSEVAVRFKVSASHVYRVRRGHRWGAA